MRMLRSLHLYLGCFFAPLLLFYAVSGFWQLFGWQWPVGREASGLALASTIHTGRGLKAVEPATLSTVGLRYFAALMAACLVVMVVTGLILAFRSAKSKSPWVAFAAGIAVPLAFVLIAFFSR